jgi:hypothetical protein
VCYDAYPISTMEKNMTNPIRTENANASAARFEARLEGSFHKSASYGLSSRPDELHSYSKAEQNGICSCMSSLFGAIVSCVGSCFAKIVAYFCPPPMSLEEALTQFFSSSTKTQKLFTIDGSKVGIIFNPGGKAITTGSMQIGDPIALISDKPIPKEVKAFIDAKKPENCTYSTLTFGSVNGQSTFAYYGF